MLEKENENLKDKVKNLKKKINSLFHKNDTSENNVNILKELKSENEFLKNAIDELKMRMQKNENEKNTVNEEYVILKNINSELQKKIKKLKINLNDKQSTIEKFTNGKQNLDAIHGIKINSNKEG